MTRKNPSLRREASVLQECKACGRETYRECGYCPDCKPYKIPKIPKSSNYQRRNPPNNRYEDIEDPDAYGIAHRGEGESPGWF